MKITLSIQNGITAHALARMCRGVLQNEENSNIKIYSLCTDSREADENTAFFALVGERVNGHDYIPAAISAGCRCIISQEPVSPEVIGENVALIAVKDSEMALSYMASAQLEGRSYPVVAVTGSVGKTTTKDMIASVMQEGKKTYVSSGNHNSVIGMPLSAMEIPTDCECAVLEMGMSNFGEIERMSLVAEPDIAIITNIGTSHMEALGDRRGICRAKLEVLCGLKKGGYLILNGDEPLLANISGRSYHTLYVSLTRPNADFFAQNIRVELGGTYFDVVYKGRTYPGFYIPVSGRHNVWAALYAFAIGTLQGLSPEQIKNGYAHFRPADMRQAIADFDGMTLIEDCYNAAPESMRAAIDVLCECAPQNSRRIAVLGDMLELGKDSIKLHRAVGEYLQKRGVDLLVAVGNGGVEIAQGAVEAGMNPANTMLFIDRDNVS
ncbi:MAG: UDP-N-acetylmuramoyl-tripeptide--D-alanyl-D-alanine ligase, partial [Clostridia bacterium]|nr:UDP-N-acetylmuramoyl-tripeptide--D-alanyl-D-alanine ligase [Clostridia bacterium]